MGFKRPEVRIFSPRLERVLGNTTFPRAFLLFLNGLTTNLTTIQMDVAKSIFRLAENK
jgi:hypothetical protein